MNAAWFVTICTQNRIFWFGEMQMGTDALHCVSTITDTNETHCTDAMHCVSTEKKPTPPQNQFGPQSKNLASIIRGFKTGVTKNARLINPDFAWQSRYHDRIIRNNAEFQRISK